MNILLLSINRMINGRVKAGTIALKKKVMKEKKKIQREKDRESKREKRKKKNNVPKLAGHPPTPPPPPHTQPECPSGDQIRALTDSSYPHLSSTHLWGFLSHALPNFRLPVNHLENELSLSCLSAHRVAGRN